MAYKVYFRECILEETAHVNEIRKQRRCPFLNLLLKPTGNVHRERGNRSYPNLERLDDTVILDPFFIDLSIIRFLQPEALKFHPERLNQRIHRKGGCLVFSKRVLERSMRSGKNGSNSERTKAKKQ